MNAVKTAEQFGHDCNPEACNTTAMSMVCPVHVKTPRDEERKPAAGMHGQSLPSSGAAKGCRRTLLQCGCIENLQKHAAHKLRGHFFFTRPSVRVWVTAPVTCGI